MYTICGIILILSLYLHQKIFLVNAEGLQLQDLGEKKIRKIS